MPVTIALKDFDNHRKRYKKLRLGIFNHQPAGVEANERDLNLFSDFFHQRGIKEITGEGILDFLCYLREYRGNQAGAINRKESSVRTYLKFLRFSQVNGACQFPIESLQRAKEPYNGPVESLEPDEIGKLLSAIDRKSVLGSRDFLFYYLLYRLGLRIGEAVNINLQDIDFENDILTIHGKGRRQRKLPILQDVREILETWFIYRSKLLNADRLDALFISKKGKRLAIRTAQDNLQKIIAKTKPFSVKKVTPHSLRHAFASHAIDGGQDMFVLKAILGHASSKSTEIYVHPSMRTLKKAVNEHIASEILNEIINANLIPKRIHQKRYILSSA